MITIKADVKIEQVKPVDILAIMHRMSNPITIDNRMICNRAKSNLETAIKEVQWLTNSCS